MTTEQPKPETPKQMPDPRALAHRALSELSKQREQLKAQDLSIPEGLDTVMQVCEVNLTMMIQLLESMAAQNAALRAVRDFIMDSEKLHAAAGQRMDVLRRM